MRYFNQLRQARTFLVRVSIGRVKVGDSYLSFGTVLEHGYDRTGPVVVEVRE